MAGSRSGRCNAENLPEDCVEFQWSFYKCLWNELLHNPLNRLHMKTQVQQYLAMQSTSKPSTHQIAAVIEWFIFLLRASHEWLVLRYVFWLWRTSIRESPWFWRSLFKLWCFMAGPSLLGWDSLLYPAAYIYMNTQRQGIRYDPWGRRETGIIKRLGFIFLINCIPETICWEQQK